MRCQLKCYAITQRARSAKKLAHTHSHTPQAHNNFVCETQIEFYKGKRNKQIDASLVFSIPRQDI